MIGFDDLLGLTRRALGLVHGIRAATLVVLVIDVVGAVLGAVGLVLLGAPAVVAVFVLGIGAVLGFLLWRFRSSLAPALEIPELLRDLPQDLADVADEIGDVATATRRGGSFFGLAGSARDVWREIDDLQDADVVQVFDRAAALRPSRLTFGAILAGCALGMLAAGALLLVMGLAFG